MGEGWGCKTEIVPLHLAVSSFYFGRGRAKLLEPLSLSVSHFSKIGLAPTCVCNTETGV